MLKHQNSTMTRIGGAVALAALVAAGSVTAVQASQTEPLKVNALSSAKASADPGASADRAFAQKAAVDFGVDGQSTKRLSADWAIARASDGVCIARLSSGEAFCGDDDTVRSGRFISIVDADVNTLPAQISPDFKAPDTLVVRGTVVGVVPDGVSRVTLEGHDGKPLATASVQNNYYEAADIAVTDIAAVTTYTGAGEASTAALPK